MSLHFDEHPAVADDHIVHFYEDEAELAGTVAKYVRDGLVAGGAAVVIATKAHRRELIAELHGVDLTAALAAGSLSFFDAELTLRALMPSGRIDRDSFRAVIAPAIDRAAAGGRHVYAFGEMVALLWADGDVASVIELESLWNELAAELRFALLCAYPSAAVAGPEHAEALQHVCRLHHGTRPRRVPPFEVTTGFTASEWAPAQARRFVLGVLREWGVGPAVVDDAVIVISELATNAVVHAGSGFLVSASSDGAAVRLAVRDPSLAPPVPRPRPRGAADGRGLHVVAALARDWGVETGRDGKTVWAELVA